MPADPAIYPARVLMVRPDVEGTFVRRDEYVLTLETAKGRHDVIAGVDGIVSFQVESGTIAEPGAVLFTITAQTGSHSSETQEADSTDQLEGAAKYWEAAFSREFAGQNSTLETETALSDDPTGTTSRPVPGSGSSTRKGRGWRRLAFACFVLLVGWIVLNTFWIDEGSEFGNESADLSEPASASAGMQSPTPDEITPEENSTAMSEFFSSFTRVSPPLGGKMLFGIGRTADTADQDAIADFESTCGRDDGKKILGKTVQPVSVGFVVKLDFCCSEQPACFTDIDVTDLIQPLQDPIDCLPDLPEVNLLTSEYQYLQDWYDAERPRFKACVKATTERNDESLRVLVVDQLGGSMEWTDPGVESPPTNWAAVYQRLSVALPGSCDEQCLEEIDRYRRGIGTTADAANVEFDQAWEIFIEEEVRPAIEHWREVEREADKVIQQQIAKQQASQEPQIVYKDDAFGDLGSVLQQLTNQPPDLIFSQPGLTLDSETKTGSYFYGEDPPEPGVISEPTDYEAPCLPGPGNFDPGGWGKYGKPDNVPEQSGTVNWPEQSLRCKEKNQQITDSPPVSAPAKVE